MKFSELPYERLDLEKTLAAYESITADLKKAASAEEQIAIMKKADNLTMDVNTQMRLASTRYTIDTRDPFYDKEREYNDNISPIILEKQLEYSRAIAESTFRKDLEQHFGSLMFTNIDLFLKSFSPELTSYIQAENVLEAQYQKLIASAQIPFDGKICNLAQLTPYMQSSDRKIRKEATLAYGKFFDDHKAELDEIYDKLVKNRTEQAHKMGFKNYVELGFLLRGRNCYDPSGIANFRKQVVDELVPITVAIKKNQAKRVGIPDFKVYDNEYFFADGNPIPQGTPDELMEAGRKMYTEMSPETAEFIKLMFDMDLFDVLAKEGKAGGGYCTNFPNYHCPFIFANWNGTAGDVDVLTHEAGHAFADYMADRYIDVPDLRDPTMEGCESHSMSMEFLTEPWHHLFFKEQTAKYELFHAESALTFIPYGCQVDHFQEIVYSRPEMTPEERNQVWLDLEHMYRPYLDNEEIPFYARGARWQRQMHIYECPFYYIDYSLAQTVSLQFWVEAMRDRKAAWEKYLTFVKQGGTKTFVDLVKSVGFRSPLEDGCLKEIIGDVQKWLEKNSI